MCTHTPESESRTKPRGVSSATVRTWMRPVRVSVVALQGVGM